MSFKEIFHSGEMYNMTTYNIHRCCPGDSTVLAYSQWDSHLSKGKECEVHAHVIPGISGVSDTEVLLGNINHYAKEVLGSQSYEQEHYWMALCSSWFTVTKVSHHTHGIPDLSKIASTGHTFGYVYDSGLGGMSGMLNVESEVSPLPSALNRKKKKKYIRDFYLLKTPDCPITLKQILNQPPVPFKEQ